MLTRRCIGPELLGQGTDHRGMDVCGETPTTQRADAKKRHLEIHKPAHRQGESVGTQGSTRFEGVGPRQKYFSHSQSDPLDRLGGSVGV